jgi:hypothetical protein
MANQNKEYTSDSDEEIKEKTNIDDINENEEYKSDDEIKDDFNFIMELLSRKIQTYNNQTMNLFKPSGIIDMIDHLVSENYLNICSSKNKLFSNEFKRAFSSFTKRVRDLDIYLHDTVKEFEEFDKILQKEKNK